MAQHERQAYSPRGVREQITQLAARLMAEEYIDDFAQAKRKAIRRLGLPEGKNLPGNEEIEAALRDYRSLYQPQHHALLRQLRECALQVMREFAAFKPYLVGSVLSGSAGEHSDINLIAYTDQDKLVELHCVNKGLAYRVETAAGGYPTLAFWVDEQLVRLSIHPEMDERQAARGADEPLARARLEQVEHLLDGPT